MYIRVTDHETSAVTLFPRSQRSLYFNILRSMRMWQRPPEDHCEACQKYTEVQNQLSDINGALLVTMQTPAWTKAQTLLEIHGIKTKMEGFEVVRKLNVKLLPLEKHVVWKTKQREYLKGRELQLEEDGRHQAAEAALSAASPTPQLRQIMAEQEAVQRSQQVSRRPRPGLPHTAAIP